MKRSELYDLVWREPLSKIAPTVGLSDAGLAKMCRRHDIPLPGRGYWAKVAAGHAMVRLPLPPTEADVDVRLPGATTPTTSPAKATMRIDQARPTDHLAIAAGDRPNVLPQSLADSHPLVRRTAGFFDKVRRELEEASKPRPNHRRPVLDMTPIRQTHCGRYMPDEPGTLQIVATLTKIDWILRFHEALIRSLVQRGCTIQAGTDQHRLPVTVSQGGASVEISFAEEYERFQPMTGTYRQAVYLAKNTFKFKMGALGTVVRTWSGTASHLEGQLHEIVETLVAALPLVQARLEAQKAAHVEFMRKQAIEAEGRAAEELRQREVTAFQEAVRAQVARAHSAADQLLNAEALQILARRMAVQLIGAPDQVRSACSDWLEVVRNAIGDPVGMLIQEIADEASKPGGPAWARKKKAE